MKDSQLSEQVEVLNAKCEMMFAVIQAIATALPIDEQQKLVKVLDTLTEGIITRKLATTTSDAEIEAGEKISRGLADLLRENLSMR